MLICHLGAIYKLNRRNIYNNKQKKWKSMSTLWKFKELLVGMVRYEKNDTLMKGTKGKSKIIVKPILPIKGKPQ